MNDFTTLPIDSRLLDEHDAKKRIARKALSFIPEHGFIYLDTGSTTLSLALELKKSIWLYDHYKFNSCINNID